MKNFSFLKCTLLNVRGQQIDIPDGTWPVYERIDALSYRIFAKGSEYDVVPESFMSAKAVGKIK